MAEQIKKAKRSKKQRKHGRGLRAGGQCQVYKIQHRRERNKLRRLKNHIARFRNDDCAISAVKNCKSVLGIY